MPCPYACSPGRHVNCRLHGSQKIGTVTDFRCLLQIEGKVAAKAKIVDCPHFSYTGARSNNCFTTSSPQPWYSLRASLPP